MPAKKEKGEPGITADEQDPEVEITKEGADPGRKVTPTPEEEKKAEG